MARCLLALGSNLGDRRENLSRATGEIASLPHTQLLARSRWHETTPIGGPEGQGAYFNGSVLVETQLAPAELASALHDVERRLGRQRIVRWDAREIDVDFLLYDDVRVESSELTVPHPRMSFRRFVLEPACEIGGWMVEPTGGWTLAQLLRHLAGAPRYVAVTASQAEAARKLAAEICLVLGGPRLEDSSSLDPSGADSPGSKGVELTLVGESFWRGIPALAARLYSRSAHALPPVVAAIPGGVTPPGHVRPALVVAWDAPDIDVVGQGPLAKITGSDLSAVVTEAIAAIRAVWPDLAESKTG